MLQAERRATSFTQLDQRKLSISWDCRPHA